MAKIDLKLLKNRAQKELGKAQGLKELNEIFNRYLGKRGELILVLRSLRRLPKAKRKKIGKEANGLKNFLKIKFNQKAQEIKEEIRKKAEEKEWIDITRPGEKPILGHLHPLTLVRRKVEEIFQAMGFSVIESRRLYPKSAS